MTFHGAALGYRRNVLLDAVDLELRRGDFLAIVGRNGSGKTTLLRTILGILKPRRGKVTKTGRLGYSPQRSALDPIFPFTAREVVAMGLFAESDPPERAPSELEKERRERVVGALDLCGMASMIDALFRDLSGGQKQRVLLARALVSDPDLLILDEPTNDLDLCGEHEIMELIQRLHADGKTVLMVSHLFHVVARYAHRLALIHEGALHIGSASEMLQADRLEELYGIPVTVREIDGQRHVSPGGARA